MNMRKNRIIFILILSIMFSFSGCVNQKSQENENVHKPKYIFLFIGDGMGASHVHLTEAFQKEISDSIGFENLTMSSFSNCTFCSTWSKNQLITDSGAAGSAIACGEKANVGEISYYLENEEQENYVSIAKIAHNNGLKVGIISTVSIDHATPAAFYAVNKSRTNYYEIGLQLHKSNYEFFGGGGFKYPEGRTNDKKNLFDITRDAGYRIVNNLNEISNDDEKLMFVNPSLLSDAEMPYAIDKNKYNSVNLSDIVNSGIQFLEGDDGFFMMVEGGKIDWAAHENDAATIVYEIIDFDNAIQIAYDFYLDHPDETLIIVTADHETGGVSLGTGNKGYQSDFAILNNQKCSGYYLSGLLSSYKRNNQTYSYNDILDLLDDNFWNLISELEEFEQIQLKEAYDYYFSQETIYNSTSLYELYGDYNPIAITATTIINNRAAVGFTTWSHTAAMVPVYSIGVGSEEFSQKMDNTEFKTKIEKIMGW